MSPSPATAKTKHRPTGSPASAMAVPNVRTRANDDRDENRPPTASGVLSGLFFTTSVLYLIFVYYCAKTTYAQGTPSLWCIAGMAGIYILSAGDLILTRRVDTRTEPRKWWCWLFPPLRIVLRDAETRTRIWLPGSGWRRIDLQLREQIENVVTLILVGLALLLGGYAAYVFGTGGNSESLMQSPLFNVLMLLVWLTIVVELILIGSMVKLKTQFIKTHRINMVIAVTPMLPLLRFALLLRILRGVFRFETFQRLVHRGRKNRLAALEVELAIKEEELERLREKIRQEQAIVRPMTTASPAPETTSSP